MLLAAMRTKLKSRVADNTLSDADADVYLNAAHKSEYFTKLFGSYTDGHHLFATTASVREYEMPDQVWDLRPGARIYTSGIGGARNNETGMRYYSRWINWYRDCSDQATENKPHSYLWFGRIVSLHPTPDAVYVIEIPGIVRDTSDLDAATDYEHERAMLIVCTAALEFAEDKHIDEQIPRHQASLARYKSNILDRSLSRVHEPKRKATY